MARLRTFLLRLTFGDKAPDRMPEYLVNGFEVGFDEVVGELAPGKTVMATAHPESYPHTLILRGPDTDQWDIHEAAITYYYEDEDPWTCRLGAVILRAEEDLQLLYTRPNRIVEV
ncbi:MAG TPA: hypothetical protein PK349_09190 [Candidatus Hydrogenedentes bacterium]|nr:hypothetical protein [Candidatus Hydrogenedentota bacterium]